MASGSQAGSTREYFVKVAKSKKRYHALKFNVGNDIDFTNTTKAELAREGYYQPKPEWEQLPKAGTGSEFNRENKEIARRKKFGFHSKGQSVDDLPWILTVKSDSEKDKLYRAKRSVANNSSYFVFINKSEIGGFEAYPLEDWYTFTPYRTYKTLTIEEAEEEFSKRHKILNKYAIMANRRKAQAGNEDEGEGAGETKKGASGGGGGGGGGSKSKTKSKWNESGDENLSDDDDEEGGDKEERSDDEFKSKGKGKKGQRSKGNNDDEDEMQLNEESDDGDHEGDEVDYISSTSEESDSDFEQTKNEEKYEEKGVDEEAAMKALEEEDDEDEEDEKLTEEGKEYKKLITQTLKEDEEASKDSAKKSSENSRGSANSSDSSDIEDPDNDPTIVSTLFDNKKAFLSAAASLNEPSSGKSSKRKATDDLSSHTSKRTNTDEAKTKSNKASTTSSIPPPTTPQTPSLMFEDEVRRYLKRKPMTVKELISKFRKKTTMSNDQLTEHLGKIFNKLKESSDFKIEEKGGTKYLSLM